SSNFFKQSLHKQSCCVFSYKNATVSSKSSTFWQSQLAISSTLQTIGLWQWVHFWVFTFQSFFSLQLFHPKSHFIVNKLIVLTIFRQFILYKILNFGFMFFGIQNVYICTG